MGSIDERDENFGLVLWSLNSDGPLRQDGRGFLSPSEFNAHLDARYKRADRDDSLREGRSSTINDSPIEDTALECAFSLWFG